MYRGGCTLHISSKHYMGLTTLYGARAEKKPQKADFAMKQTNIMSPWRRHNYWSHWSVTSHVLVLRARGPVVHADTLSNFTPPPRPPGIPVREFPGIPGNPPLQKFPAGIPGNFWIFGKISKFSYFLLWIVKARRHENSFSPFYEFKSPKLLDSGHYS